MSGPDRALQGSRPVQEHACSLEHDAAGADDKTRTRPPHAHPAYRRRERIGPVRRIDRVYRRPSAPDPAPCEPRGCGEPPRHQRRGAAPPRRRSLRLRRGGVGSVVSCPRKAIRGLARKRSHGSASCSCQSSSMVRRYAAGTSIQSNRRSGANGRGASRCGSGPRPLMDRRLDRVAPARRRSGRVRRFSPPRPGSGRGGRRRAP